MEDDMSKAHHTGKRGKNRFKNPWPSHVEHTFTDFFGCFFRDFRKVVIPSKEELDRVLPTVQPNWNLIRERVSGGKEQAREAKDDAAGSDEAKVQGDDIRKGVAATWVGHATFLLQFDSFSVLTDPIFSKRCSAVQFVGPKRYKDAPFEPSDLPSVDVAIISHSHYDHTDKNSIRALKDKVGKWFVPLGLREWFVSEGVPEARVEELDWWQESSFTRDDGSSLRIVCTPCQHFSGRSLTDHNETLWSSWVVQGDSHKIWFAGDTGYRTIPRGLTEQQELDRLPELPVCPAFREIGEREGPFDLSCIPIGAYSPRWFMSPVHLNPLDAVEVHRAVRSKQSVGMHWGTFKLTDEPILEPPQRLAAELKRAGLDESVFVAMKHGETRVFDPDAQVDA